MLAANVALAVLLAQRSVAAQIGDADANCVGWWARQCRWGRPAPEGLSSEEDSACSASGEAFPPVPGATWAKVLEQMTRCITGFYEGRYLEVQWDPINFWQHWPMDGDLDVPATFGICIPKGRCQDFAIQWLLIPLLWVYVKKGGPQHVNHHEPLSGSDLSVHRWHRCPPRSNFVPFRVAKPRRVRKTAAFFGLAQEIFQHASNLMELGSQPPGHPKLLQGTKLKESIYDRAMRELERDVDESQHSSGVVCIVGHLRSFGERAVYESLRRNVIDALRFSDLRTVLVTEFGPQAPAEERHNPWRSWGEMADALETVAPDVVVNIPVHIEGHPPGRRCHEKYPMSCNAQWRRLELCMEQVKSFEQLRGAPVDWVVRVRTDMFFSVPIGDIRVFDAGKVHLPTSSWTDAHDTFAMIPRQHADVYFSTRHYDGADYCWISPRENIRSDDCCHRLKLQLLKHEVPVKRFALLWQPWEIIDRYIVRPTTWNGSKLYGQSVTSGLT